MSHRSLLFKSMAVVLLGPLSISLAHAEQALRGGAANYESFYGAWRGQTSFKEAVSGSDRTNAHVIAAVTLVIEEGGRVTGAAQDVGCNIVGAAGPGPVPTEPSLAVTVSSCSHRAFNRKYTGSLVLHPRDGYATLHLVSLPPSKFGKAVTCDISATLKR